MREKSDTPRKGRRKTKDAALERRIASLESRNGLTRALAAQVASGHVDLDTVLQRMALQARVDSLMRRHELGRALATQVAMGQADLERVLFKRRMELHFAEMGSRSVLKQSVADGLPMYLCLHGQRHLDGPVASVDQYEFTTGDESIHKLQLKWACALKDKKKARRALSWDKERRAAPQEPVWTPQQRFCCSNKRLFTLMDRERSIHLQLLEGEQFIGQVKWVGRFEFALAVKGGVELVIFRHALESLKELS
ncbi:MAG: sRNA-binding regulator protein Hfq [Cognaticolwellia sp.]